MLRFLEHDWEASAAEGVKGLKLIRDIYGAVFVSDEQLDVEAYLLFYVWNEREVFVLQYDTATERYAQLVKAIVPAQEWTKLSFTPLSMYKTTAPGEENLLYFVLAYGDLIAIPSPKMPWGWIAGGVGIIGLAALLTRAPKR